MKDIKVILAALLACCLFTACSQTVDNPLQAPSSSAASSSTAEGAEDDVAPAGTQTLEHGELDILHFPSLPYEGTVVERDWILNKVEQDFSYQRNEINHVENRLELGIDEQGEDIEIYHTVVTNPQTGRSVRRSEQLLAEQGYLQSRYYYEDILFLEDMTTSWDLVWADDDFVLGTSGYYTFFYDIQNDVLEYICYPFTEQIPKNADNAIDFIRFFQMDVNAHGLVSMDFSGKQLVYCVEESDGFAGDGLLYYNWTNGESFLFQEDLIVPELGAKTSVFAHFTGDSLYYSLRHNPTNNAISICRLDIPSRTVETYITSGSEASFLGGARFIAFNRFSNVYNAELYQPQELEQPLEFIVHDLETGENVYRAEGSFLAMLYNRYVLYLKDGGLYAFDLMDRQLYLFRMDQLDEQFPDQTIEFNTVLVIDGQEYMPDYLAMLSAQQSSQ